MSLSVRNETGPDGEQTVVVGGELDAATAPLLRSQLAGLTVAAGDTLVLDLRDLVFIDSSGLGVLANAASRLAEVGGVVVVANPSTQARSVMQLTHLDEVIAIVEDAG